MARNPRAMRRREFLRLATGTASCLLAPPSLLGAFAAEDEESPRSNALRYALWHRLAENQRAGLPASRLPDIGALQAADENGIQLPAGFSSRVIARAGSRPVADSTYRWHGSPDDGDTFEHPDGGWIYVSNSELDSGAGGVGALRFDGAGELVDAYSIMSGGRRNCAGGRTPWGTWLSCEEVSNGRVWECDPMGREDARNYPSLGRFNHEAAVVDPLTGAVYLTEDERDGRFYRFTPDEVDSDGRSNLDSGTLEVATLDADDNVRWTALSDAAGRSISTRRQVSGSTAFNRGEGMVYHDGTVYFTTTGDHRVYGYKIAEQTMEIIYDRATADVRILGSPDNIDVSHDGHLLVAEDTDNLEIVVITTDGDVLPLLRVTGQPNSEITGPAFSPDMSRLYFSSQRGRSGALSDGLTYEVTGPFLES